jgi:deoxyribonuclease-4
MRLGVHIGIAKGLESAVDRARRIGCEAIQIFSSNPNAWRISPLDPKTVDGFRTAVAAAEIYPISLHTPYLLNLASSKDTIWTQSWENLASALQRATTLGASYVVTHIGSHGGDGFDAGADRIKQAVSKALDHASNTAIVLLEAGSGAGNTVGSTFEELAAILERFDRHRNRVGVCLDTAHLWGAGYDISSAEGVEKTLTDFGRLVGITNLQLFHLNDTQKLLGSHLDRHWHIGQGNIGDAGFSALVNHPALSDIAGIIETPEMELGRDVENLDTLKRLRR